MKLLSFVLLAICLSLPSATLAEPIGSAFTYQGELKFKGLPANDQFDLGFRLWDTDVGGSRVGTAIFLEDVVVVDGNFTVELDFGTDPFLGKQLWLQILVRVGSSTGRWTNLSPRQKLTASPFALSSAKLSGTVDVSQITGLLGQGFSLFFPDLLNNSVFLEIQGIVVPEDVIIITGPGVDVEVIEGFDPTGKPRDVPGVGAEHPFVFESGNEEGVTNLKLFFDNFIPGDRRAMSLIIPYANGDEFNRFNLFEYEPDFYEPAIDGRTRFHFRPFEPPDNVMRWEIGGFGDMFQDVGSFNPAIDKMVEISGVTQGPFFPEVVHDEENRTLTFTFTYNEGGGLIEWIRQTVINGELIGLKSLSVIEWTGEVETGRTNYFETFPIRFEMTGYARNTKLIGTVVVKYAWSEVAN
jgi:hypothetical protein